MKHVVMTMLAVAAFVVAGAESVIKDTFAVCQISGAEREGARVIAAGAVRECSWENGKALAMQVFLPATGKAEWKLSDGVTARPLDDRLTAELKAPGLKAPVKLALDTWHLLVLARGHVYLAGYDLGECRVRSRGTRAPTNPSACIAGSSACIAGSTVCIGGGAEFYATREQGMSFKSDAEIDQFLQGLPPPLKVWEVPAERRRLVKGQSLPFEHGLAPTNTTAYTLVVDVKFPKASWSQWRSFYTTDLKLDGSAFVNPDNRFGIAGRYVDVALQPDTVHRVAVAYDGRGAVSLYWDGTLFVSARCEKAGFRHPSIWLGGDENGEDGEIEINKVMFYGQALEARVVQKLGGCK